MRKLLASLASGAAVLALAGPASAHVTVQPTEAPVGSFFRFVVRVPNERDDATTTKVEVQFPQNLVFVSFQDTAGWKRTVRMKHLDEPIEVFGEEVDEVVGSVTWSGGSIAPHEFEEFGFSAKVPDGEEVLEFPAIQTYDSGDVVRWIGPPESEEPAARVATIDIGAGESGGELEVIAQLRAEVAELKAQPTDTSSDADSGDTGTVLGGIGIGVGAVALVIALMRRR
jgi:uncharacterized protein YcnI